VCVNFDLTFVTIQGYATGLCVIHGYTGDLCVEQSSILFSFVYKPHSIKKYNMVLPLNIHTTHMLHQLCSTVH